jgi:hypothetical protein
LVFEAETVKLSYMTVQPSASQMAFNKRLAAMSELQDRAAALVLPHMTDVMVQSKLCGGTALSRFYLQHRISYDLDFFIPPSSSFDAQAMANHLASKVKLFNLELTHDAVKADQLHFAVLAGDEPIKLSFVEDMYSDVFPAVKSAMLIEGVALSTESIEGLYHRKLRTVVGWADSDSVAPAGGRQTARDMFDLYVLSQSAQPLKQFIQALPYAFPATAFEDGLARMPWFDLSAELGETIAAPRWQAATDVEVLRSYLYAQIGMTDLPDDLPPGEA